MRKRNIKAVLKEDIENEECWKLTPRGVAVAALLESDLIADVDDERADLFWELFVALMILNGYVQEES